MFYAVRSILMSPVAAALVPLALSCAHAPTFGQGNAKAEMNAGKTERVVVTGSHIPQSVDVRTGMPATTEPVRIWSRDELERKGYGSNVGAAISRLDPSF